MAGPSTALVHCWSGLAGPAAKSLPWSVGLLRLPWDAILKRQVWRVVQSSCEESKLCLLLPGSEICKSLIIRIPAPKKSGYCPAVLVVPDSITEVGMSINCHLSIHYTPFSLCVMFWIYCTARGLWNKNRYTHRTAFEMLCELSVPFLLMPFGDGLEMTYLALWGI